MLNVLFAIAMAISYIEGHLIADSCSISCPGEGITTTNLRQNYIGPPGKRGAIGPPGPTGPIGRIGPKGEQGDSCDCRSFEDKIASLDFTVERLKSVILVEWSEASNHRWYRLFRTQLNFQKARDTCKRHGGRLASAGMRGSVMREILSMVGIRRGEHVWIGLSDLAQEGSWVWDDGSTAPVTSWVPGQPDNSGNEDCGILWNDYAFNDLGCNYGHNFLCEMDRLD